jgi:hypothetical protein
VSNGFQIPLILMALDIGKFTYFGAPRDCGFHVSCGTVPDSIEIGGFRYFENGTGKAGVIQPDGLGGYRRYSNSGKKSWSIRPDGLGGSRGYDSTGKSWTTQPDGLGGYRIYDDKTNEGATTVRPDGLGGFRINGRP